MICKDLCYKFKGENIPNYMRYLRGEKRCTVCEMYIKCEGLRCPCCGARMRLTARTKKYQYTRI